MELWAPGFYLIFFLLVNSGLRGHRSYGKYFNKRIFLFVLWVGILRYLPLTFNIVVVRCPQLVYLYVS